MPAKPPPVDWSGVTKSIGPNHRSIIQGHFLRLDARARVGRFWHDAPVTHLNGYTSTLDLDDGVFLGAFPDQTLRALAEARPMGLGGQAWEAVVSVECAWQEQGLGTWLLTRAMHLARQQGATRLYMKSDMANTAAKKVALHLGASLSESDGDAVAKIDLRSATQLNAVFGHFSTRPPGDSFASQ